MKSYPYNIDFKLYHTSVMLQFSNCRDWSDTEFDYENENVTHKSTQFTDGKLQEMKNEQEKIGLGVGMGEENIQKLP